MSFFLGERKARLLNPTIQTLRNILKFWFDWTILSLVKQEKEKLDPVIVKKETNIVTGIKGYITRITEQGCIFYLRNE